MLFAVTELPPRRRAWAHLAALVAFAALLRATVGWPAWAATLPLWLGLAWALTCGRADLHPYWAAPAGWGQVLRQTLLLLLLHLMLGALGQAVLGDPDPQGVRSVPLSSAAYVSRMATLPLVAAGEEALKALWGLALLSLLPGRPGSQGPEVRRPAGRGLWWVRVAAASLAVALLFGGLHAIHWPMAAVLPIALSSVLDLGVLLYHRSLLPLVGAHFLLDGLHFTGRYAPDVAGWLLVGLQVWVLAQVFFLPGEKPR